MMKIEPSITLELQSGQRISLGIEEAKELTNGLARFVGNGEAAQVVEERSKNVMKTDAQQRRKVPGMSEDKKNEIIKHVLKKLSKEPKTLSYLLKGISYIPNHLPMIRQFVEDQPHISKRRIGKRTFYSLQSPGNGRMERHPKVAAAA